MTQHLAILKKLLTDKKLTQGKIAKLLGAVRGDAIQPATFRVTAHANRVSVEYGHTVCMSIGLNSSASPDEIARTLTGWTG